MLELNPQTPFLATNFYPDFMMVGMREHIHPFLEKTLENGTKIGIVAPTTKELVFTWLMNRGVIIKPYKVSEVVASSLKERGASYVISLSHLGYDKDMTHIRKSKSVDIVLGGHSHVTMTLPELVANKKGRSSPLIHNGHHGRYL